MNCIHSLSLAVAGTPIDLTATRLKHRSGSCTTSLGPFVSGVVGYEVFYQVNGSSTVVGVANTTNTMLNITSGLISGVTYDFFVVSYGDSTVLPSNRSTTSLTFSKYMFSATALLYN